MSKRQRRIRAASPTTGWDLERTREEVRQRVLEMEARRAGPPPGHDPWVPFIRYMSCLMMCAAGAGLVFGPASWRSSNSFRIIYSFTPWRVQGFGLALLTVGLLQLASVVGHWASFERIMFIVTGVAAVTASLSFVFAAFIGSLQDGTGPPFLLFFGLVQLAQAGRIDLSP